MSPAKEHLDHWRQTKKNNSRSVKSDSQLVDANICPNCHQKLEKDESGGQFTFKVCPNCKHVFDLE